MKEAARNLIIRLKDVKAQKGLTVADIVNLLDEIGEPLSTSTVRRVFEKGSEDRPAGFRADTLASIAKAIVEEPNVTPDEIATLNALGKELAAENAALKALVDLRDATIAQLEARLADLEAKHAALVIRHEATQDVIRTAAEAFARGASR